jgi:glutamyl-tRNA reductase
MSETVVQVGIDHRGASLAELGRLHAARRRGAANGAPAVGYRGVVGLVTCHRLELYVEGASEESARALFANWLGGDGEVADLVAGAALRSGRRAAEHLLRVAAGLESAVLGEDQILGQVRSAYREAVAAGAAGPLLHRLFHAAFRAGRRVRCETAIAGGARSLPAAAIGLLSRRLGGLAGRRFLIIGAGEMGSLAATRLRDRGAGEIVVTSRTRLRAETLASRLGARVLPWTWRTRLLSEVDAVACATGAAEPVLTAKDLRLAIRKRSGPLVIVDLGVPRDVETPVEETPGLDVIDMATIALHLRQGAAARAAAVEEAERVVAEELETWWSWAVTRDPRAGDPRRARRGLAVG